MDRYGYVWSVAILQARLSDGRSGLLLCIGLLSEALDLLRAMMESAPRRSWIYRRCIACVIVELAAELP
jgi:hypothetical protein